MTSKNSKIVKTLIPVFFCFAVMGFIDITGVATSYVKQDFQLSDRVANLLPGMTMIWFLLISLPSAALMRVIGRKATVLASLAVMSVALALPLLAYDFKAVFAAFALLGIGNTILQVSLNPLLKNVLSDDKMTSALSFGQFVKSIVSLLGPILIGTAAASMGNWTAIFYLYAAATVVALVWLWLTPVKREALELENTGSRGSVFGLLADSYTRACFLVILMVVGFEICLTTVIPQYFMNAFSMTIEKSGVGCSVYYAAKTAGTFVGAVVLSKVSPVKFLRYTSLALCVVFVAYWTVEVLWVMYFLIFLIGLAGANAFAIALSLSMNRKPESSNDISALMMTGIAGGAVLPPVMGLVSDAVGLKAGLAVPFAALCALSWASVYIGSRHGK